MSVMKYFVNYVNTIFILLKFKMLLYFLTMIMITIVILYF